MRAHQLMLAVAIGGAVGSVLRFWTVELVRRLLTDSWTFVGTMSVNVLGCLAIGILGTLSSRQTGMSPWMSRCLITGVLGGFTTFSAFGFETMGLLSSGRTSAAVANVAVNLILGLGSVWLGIQIATRLIV